jgi:hypothetical protein
MNLPFAAVEIVFQTNHPTVLKQKISREKLHFNAPFLRSSPTAQLSAKPHLVGNDVSLYPTYCGDKKNFQKSYNREIPK